MENNIPQIIHYCWFGGNPLPELAKQCIASWKKYCPNYEIKEWNENNFDVNSCDYVREAYEAKKWAFVSDVVRLYALVNYGGIYMDTDVEVLKPLDDILSYEAVSGFQHQNTIPTGLMACKKGNALFDELLHEYDEIHFKLSDGTYDLTSNVRRITKTCLKYGFIPNNTKQTVNSFTIFPPEYFCPKNPDTGVINITKNTYTIHHFDASWKSDAERKAIQFAIHYQKILPVKMLKFIGTVRYGGAKIAVKKMYKDLKSKVPFLNK